MRQRYIYHRIEQGDTMKSIAKKYGITTYAITRNNPDVIGDRSLKVGSFLVIGLLNDENASGGDDAQGGSSDSGNGSETDKENGEQEDEDAGVDLPERWLTDQEIQQAALERVGSNKEILEQLAYNKSRALEKLEEKAIRDAFEHNDAINALKSEAEADKKNFLQDAIQQGIARSSVVESVNRQYDRQRDGALEKQEQIKELEDAERLNAKNEVLNSYNFEVNDAKKKYQHKYEDAVNDIREKNQKANIALTVSGGGVSNVDSYELTDKLLDTLSKKQATDYLERNKERLVEIWGDNAYLKLVQKYK